MDTNPSIMKPPAKVALIQPFEIEEPNTAARPEAAEKQRSKWRTTIAFGALAACLVMLVNIAILTWTITTHHISSGGNAVLYTGSCERTKHITLWADLAINILSTVLLSASNTCSQLCCAPTRIDVDRAHARSHYLDIGVQSLRNLRFIPRRRHLMWWLVAFSSIPLHLFYNSVIFSTSSANDYQAALVTEDFVKGGWWNRTRVADNNIPADQYESQPQDVNIGQLQFIQQEAQANNLTRLDNAACLQAYGTTMFEANWRNVLLVTNLTMNDTFIQAFEHHPSNIPDLIWPCQANYTFCGTGCSIQPPKCDVGKLISHADDWTLKSVTQCPKAYDPNCTTFDAPVQYCLAEPFPADCTVQVASSLLIVVIVFNAIKLACMITMAVSDAEPITTVGDAIASFLTKPDPLTKGHGALPARAVWDSAGWQDEHQRGRPYQAISSWKAQSRFGTYQPAPFKRLRRRAWRGVSLGRYCLCLLLCLAALIAGWALLGEGISSSYSNNKSIASQGLGEMSPYDMVTLSVGRGLVTNVLLANLPQLIISFIYLFYNSCLTGMLLTAEYSRFVSERKTLRVSKPEGQQRSTYWLNVPWWYSVPLMACMAVLHWLVSRSIFLMQVAVYDNNGVEVPDRNINACGYSPLAILLATMVGLLLTIALIMLSVRKLDPGMPLAGSCSVAIAAACHCGDGEMAKLPLQYGVTDDGRKERDRRYDYGEWYSAAEPEVQMRPRVGFSSEKVGPLVDGVVYF